MMSPTKIKGISDFAILWFFVFDGVKLLSYLMLCQFTVSVYSVVLAFYMALSCANE